MHDTAFIGRQPILDRKQMIIGYELLFRRSASAASAEVVDDIKASSRVLMNTVSEMGTQWLLGDKLAFINVNEEFMRSDLLQLLVPQRTVLEVLETVTPSPDVIRQMNKLRVQGFKIALDDYVHTPENATLLPSADFIKYDVMAQGLDRCGPLMSLAKSLAIRMIAEKVETQEEFERCKKLGFDFFQGYYFAKPEILSTASLNPVVQTVLNLLNLVRRDADIREVELGFKPDPALAYKLLRYINSACFGFPHKILSLRQALTIIGTKQLYRFLTLLLIPAVDKNTSAALVKTAITRGRLAELLGSDHFDQSGRDNLFIIGIFSLLDVMLDMPMEQVLEKLDLSEPINEALLHKQGVYGPFLQLTEAYEGEDASEISKLADHLNYSPSKLNACHFAALAWAESLTA